MSGRMQFDLTLGQRARSTVGSAGAETLSLVVIGDLSGLESNRRPALADRMPARVDLDRFDTVISAFAPTVQTEWGALCLDSLDAFHPDALFGSHALFDSLRQARRQPPPAGGDSPLAALLGGPPARASTPVENGDDSGLDALIRRVVAPHVVPDRGHETAAYQAAIDAAIGEQMRQLLHAPAFQALESAWRGIDWLISRLDLDEDLKLLVLDVSQDEILADLAACGANPDASALRKALARCGKGAVLASLYAFDDTESDAAALAWLGVLASHGDGPLLASARNTLWAAAGPGSAHWNALRASTAAAWIGLVAPRMLLRQPYGMRSDPVECFAFEELADDAPAAQFLWASGALSAALLIGQAFRDAEGGPLPLGAHRQIDDLPQFTRRGADGEPELVPCAEAFLSDSEAEALLERGLMPLLSHRHRNAVQLHRFRSISVESPALAGLPA